jgi:DNA processing protein
MIPDAAYWLAFSLMSNVGGKRIEHLYKVFGSLDRAWNAPRHRLEPILGQKTYQKFAVQRDQIDLDAELRKVDRAGAWLLPAEDPRYPELLRLTADPPPLLYVRGQLTEADERAIAIVGTRKATRAGREVAANFARDLAANGMTVVSGLAHGIDTAAHEGSLAAGGRTIAVLGTGIDIDYPPENRTLADRISEQGAILSEFPIGTQPIGRNFPKRNRVMSGISLGVLVTEAPANSGALITADFAAEQGREVFAIPGSIYNKMARGTNQLIQDGAKLVMDVGDILDELNIAHTTIQTQVRTEQVAPSNDIEHALLNILHADPIHIDELARLSGLPIHEVNSTMALLELKGLAQLVGHMQYSRTDR